MGLHPPYSPSYKNFGGLRTSIVAFKTHLYNNYYSDNPGSYVFSQLKLQKFIVPFFLRMYVRTYIVKLRKHIIIPGVHCVDSAHLAS